MGETSLNDIVPVFNLFFSYILPSILLLLFIAILYKLIQKFAEKIRKLISFAHQDSKKSRFSLAVNTFYDFVDFIFMDCMVAFVIVIPMILMIINFISQNSIFMLQHFWDYTYPALTVIMVITSLKIWTNVIRRIREVFS
ncbi:MAG: hypothetical protein J7J42_01735 [Thermoplasmata archaeon]|nr:hypothetical protein [Thermoplasmata archaeon]